MGIFSGIFSRDTKAPAITTEQKRLDALLVKQHAGTELTTEQYAEIGTLAHSLGMSEAQVEQRQKWLVKQPKAKPEYNGPGVILATREPEKFADSFIVYSSAGTPGRADGTAVGPDVIDDLLRDSPKKLPNLYATRYHRAPGQSKDEFAYLTGLLVDLHAGRITAGRCAFLVRAGDKYPPSRARPGMPSFNVDAPPLNFQPDDWFFVRRPGQSQREVDKYAEQIRENVEKERKANGLVYSGPKPNRPRW